MLPITPSNFNFTDFEVKLAKIHIAPQSVLFNLNYCFFFLKKKP
jgi:hypothetical protein